MRLPKSVKIAHIEHTIQPWKPLEHEGDDAYGMYLCSSARILIQTDLSLPVLQDTLLHEIMHGIVYWYNILDTDREEEVVCKMSTGLLQVLKDNPRVRNFILK
jgi:hypothetical protein